MAITQLSVFMENKPGQLAAAVKLISEGGVNIRALSLADTKADKRAFLSLVEAQSPPRRHLHRSGR